MNDISLTDIFFIITGSAVVIITIMIAIGLLYVISFVRTIRRVGKTAQRATELVSQDISDLRDNIREKGVNIGTLTNFAKGIAKKNINRKK
jgi:5-bromo-4-chloroindolyl phosphate hydrolysis protein